MEVKELLKHYIGKELFIDDVFAFQYLMSYAERVHLLKSERSSESFRTLKSASDEIRIISGNGVVEITNFSKLKTDVQANSIISFDIEGFMQSSDGLCSTGIKTISNALLSYKDNPNVIGAKINFDTGGGEGMSGHILHNAIKEFAKPVIAYVYNAGSAGYLAASAATEVIAANPNTRVGSIGALISLSKKFLEEYAADIVEIYSDLSSEKNKEFRSLLQGDTEPMKEMLNKSVELFHKVIKQNRELKEDPKGTLKGGMFFAEDAKRRGLIDFIGNNEFALSRITKYSKIKK